MFNLLRHFSLTAGVVILILSSSLIYVFYSHEVGQLIAAGERQNVRIARLLANSLRPELHELEQYAEASASHIQKVEKLNQMIRNLAKGLPIIKVKYYSLDGKTLYSNEFNQIWEDKSENPGFIAAAQQGNSVSKLTHRDEFSAFSHTLTNRDVVETYIPLHGEESEEIEAVFELYSDVTPLVEKISDDTVLLISLLVLSFSGLYAALFVIVRRADGILSTQYLALANSEEKLRDKKQMLEREVLNRQRAEERLRKARDELEITVQQRTSDLAQAVEELQSEVKVRYTAEQNLRMLSTAVEQSPASVAITNTDGIIQYANPKFLKVSGYDSDEVIGHDSRLLSSGEMPNDIYKILWNTIRKGNEWNGELLNRKKDGTLFWELVSISPIRDEHNQISHYVEVKEDISLRKRYEEQLLKQANYDELTGLANRLLMMDRLSQAIARAQRFDTMVALFFIDLDDFKKVNDSLGHQVGDEMLIEFGQRIEHCVRNTDSIGRGSSAGNDTIARLGGDEFTVVLTDLKEPTAAEWVATSILAACAKPFNLSGQEVFVTTSIGITVYPNDSSDIHDLMRNADLAMYRAKHEGAGTFRFFTKKYDELAIQQLQTESELRHAIERGELTLHYQPIVDNETADVSGAEALLRWNSQQLGNLSPDLFIPIAESTGLIVDIGRWIIETALADYPILATQSGSDSFYLSINISSRQLREPGFADELSKLLDQADVPVSNIRIEITESLIIEETQQTQENLDLMTKLGVRFSIDDFGTGYSSLKYLKKIPVDTLKIDRSFVSDVSSNPDDASLVRSIAAMAKGLGIQVIAEGVETEDQLSFITQAGCHFTQGWLTGKPVPVADFNRHQAQSGNASPDQALLVK